jgi:hypothetical protein
MDKIIATIVIIVLTLGLISYAIIGQIGGIKDAGDKVGEEQSRLNIMLSDPNIVPGSTVKEYQSNQKTMGYTVVVFHDGITPYTSSVNDKSLYTMKKYIAPDGNLTKVEFVLKDLSGK